MSFIGRRLKMSGETNAQAATTTETKAPDLNSDYDHLTGRLKWLSGWKWNIQADSVLEQSKVLAEALRNIYLEIEEINGNAGVRSDKGFPKDKLEIKETVPETEEDKAKRQKQEELWSDWEGGMCYGY